MTNVLNPRFENDGKPTVYLTDYQLARCAKFKEEFYLIDELRCTICGTGEFSPISNKDRYGLEYKVGICKNCGNLQAYRYYSADSISRFYSLFYRDIYGGLSSKNLYMSQYKLRGPRIYNFIKDVVSPKANVLEIGCGSGGILAYLRDRGFIVKGIDLNDGYLKFGREKGLDLECVDAENYEAESKFDLIILADVVEHFLDPIKSLDNIKRLLRENGQIYIEVPSLHSIPIRYDGNLLKYFQNAHVNNYTKHTFMNLLAVTELEAVKINDAIQSLVRLSSRQGELKNFYEEVMAELKGIEEFFEKNGAAIERRRRIKHTASKMLDRFGLLSTAVALKRMLSK